jgi:hypothetical protein
VPRFLLVDDGDGRVLAEFSDASQALRTLDELEQESPGRASSLCLVTFDEHQGSIIGAETTTRLRPLT